MGNRLIEVKSKIFGDGSPIERASSALVVVHPWFATAHAKKTFDFRKGRDEYSSYKEWGRFRKGDYSHNIRELFKNWPGNIFVFEKAAELQRTVEGVDTLRNGLDMTYFIPTAVSAPVPLSGWSYTLNFVNKLSDRLFFAGGYLCRDEQSYYGCLGEAYVRFMESHPRCRFVEDACFAA